MYWETVLSSAIETGVAIAGFSGIVVVLGRRELGEWSPIERVRLRSLLGASFAAVSFSFFPFVLFSAGLSPQATWRLGSAVVGLLFGSMAVIRFRQFRAAAPAIATQDWLTFLVVTVVVSLLFINAIRAAAPWPYLLAVLANLGLAISQFVRLLLDLRQ